MRSNSTRAKTAIVFIWIVMGMEMIQLVSSYFQYLLLSEAASGGFISHEAAATNDLREQLLGIAAFIVYVISGITFIQWFRRAYFNLHTKVSHLECSEGWAAGAWFTPWINLFRPYRIMRELFRETRIILNGNSEQGNRSSTIAVDWWWALWIISGIASQVSLQVSLRNQTIDGLMVSTVAGMVGSVLTLPLAIITVKVITDYSRLEEQLYTLPEEQITESEPAIDALN